MKSSRQSSTFGGLRALAPAVLMSLALLGADAGPEADPAARRVEYAQPVDHVKVGPLAQIPGAVVLPSGRLSTPAGLHMTVAGEIVAAALSRNSRYLVVAVRAAGAAYVQSLDAHTLKMLSRVLLPGASLGGGIIVTPDPQSTTGGELVTVSTGLTGGVAFADLADDGSLSLDAIPTANISGPTRPHFTSSLASSALGAQGFVIDEIGGTVTPLELRERRMGVSTGIGLGPHGLARIGHELVIANEGIVRPQNLTSVVPQFTPPAFDLSHAGSSSILNLPPETRGPSPTAHLAFPDEATNIPMDPTPQNAIVGGAHPTAVTGAGGLAFLALSNVDRIAVISLTQDKVIGGTELRFFDRGPYGTQPTALALDPTEHRLYVALGGIDSVAVLNVAKGAAPHRLGLIPTGYAPSSLAIDRKGRALFIISQTGLGKTTGLVQRVDLAHVNLGAETTATLRDVRRVVSAAPATRSSRSRVVQIRMPASTYDEVFGPAAHYDAEIMPNLHRLAHRYVLAANFYSTAEGPLAGDQLALSGETLPATARTEIAGGARRWEGTPNMLGYDDAPRYGFIFDALTRAQIPFRNYGFLAAIPRYNHTSDALYAAALSTGRAAACATEFVHDHASDGEARFIAIALPDLLDQNGEIAAREADAALGTIIDALQQDAQWAQTTVFISPYRSGGGPDRVDPHHIYAVVIAPGVTKGSISGQHRSVESILKTDEAILGLPPSTLGDLLTSPIDGLAAGVSGPNG